MTEPLQTPPVGTQQPAEVTPQEDLNETEQLLAEKQAAIEAEAKALMDPENKPPEPPKGSIPQQPQIPGPEVTPTPVQTPVPPQEDFEEKFRQSSREANNLVAAKRQTEERLKQLTNINITENELRALYPDWDSMNEIEKRAFRETALANKKANQALDLATNMMEQQQWAADFARTLKANPALAGREEAFKEYCYKPSHKSVPIDVLVKSFLFDVQITNIPTPALPAPGLERGSGGPRETGNGEMNEEQLGLLRTSSPEAYRKAIQAKIRKEQRR
jgi:hypothetical protein